jgi:hypothetical protein
VGAEPESERAETPPLVRLAATPEKSWTIEIQSAEWRSVTNPVGPVSPKPRPTLWASPTAIDHFASLRLDHGALHATGDRLRFRKTDSGRPSDCRRATTAIAAVVDRPDSSSMINWIRIFIKPPCVPFDCRQQPQSLIDCTPALSFFFHVGTFRLPCRHKPSGIETDERLVSSMNINLQ